MKSEQQCHKSYFMSGTRRQKFQRNFKYSLFCTQKKDTHAHTHTHTHTEIRVVHVGQST
jgi:galactose-1-phosphate uridylyltransferase